MSASEISDSPQLQLFNEWKRGYVKRDIDIIAGVLHKDLRKVSYPRSLGRPDESKEEWVSQMKKYMDPWAEDPEMDIHSVIADTPGKLVIHVTGRVKTSAGVNMERESIFVIHIVTDEDGSLKMKEIEEFTDSKTNVEYYRALGAAGYKERQGA